MDLLLHFALRSQNASLPQRAHPHDAGLDLKSAEDVVIAPGEFRAVGTSLTVALPAGTVGLIHPRSGLAAKHGVTVLNAPGTIDSGYRGEVKVLLINHGSAPFTIWTGDRIAQLVIIKVELPTPAEAPLEQIEDSERGEGGFGSTGVRS